MSRVARRVLGSDKVPAIAIWSEDTSIEQEQGNLRFPIRVVMVDDHMQTKLDRLVKVPDPCVRHYKVLDHGVPWQVLDRGLYPFEVKERIIDLAKSKILVMYDANKTIGLHKFDQRQLNRFKIFDIKTREESKDANGVPMSFWDLIQAKLGHIYSGQPGHYDIVELADFVMSIYLQYTSSPHR